MKKIFMVLAVAAAMIAVAACKNSTKAAEECTECGTETCTECAAGDSTCCKACCADSSAVAVEAEAAEVKAE